MDLEYEYEDADLRAEVREECRAAYHWCSVCLGHTGNGSPCQPESETDSFVRDREEAEEDAARKFLLAASLGNASAPVDFVKSVLPLSVGDIVFEAIGYDRDLQVQAMQLVLTLACGDCSAAKELLQRAAKEWAEQNAQVAA